MIKKKTKKAAIKPKAMIGKVEVWCDHSEILKLSELKPNPDNPNIHTDDQIKRLSGLIKRHGWRHPITISNRSGFIVRGHGRYLAAVSGGMGKVPVDFQDYESHIDEQLDLIADNKIAELSFVDDELVKKLFDDLDGFKFDVQDAGYEPGEIEAAEAEKNKLKEPAPEIAFAKEILLSHNYVVLYFDNEFDWQVAVDKFDLKRVKDFVPRKGQPTGIGRVVSGRLWLDRIK